MDTTLHLNRSSSVVQRVLRLRQLIEQSERQTGEISTPTQVIPGHQDYQLQSWQKSDSSLAGEYGIPPHRCRS